MCAIRCWRGIGVLNANREKMEGIQPGGVGSVMSPWDQGSRKRSHGRDFTAGGTKVRQNKTKQNGTKRTTRQYDFFPSIENKKVQKKKDKMFAKQQKRQKTI